MEEETIQLGRHKCLWQVTPWGVAAGSSTHPIYLVQTPILQSIWKNLLAYSPLSEEPERRLLLLHGGAAERSWGELTRQQQILSRLEEAKKVQIAHLHLPHVLLDVRLDQTRRQTHALSRLHNALGWLEYCRWLNRENQALLREIPLGLAEEFQLEAACENFDTEIHSDLLKEMRGKLAEVINEEDRMAQGGSANQRVLFDLEKRLIRLRLETEQILEGHEEALDELFEALNRLIPDHPELALFTLHLKILHRLITDLTGQREQGLLWIQQLHLLQLLNWEWKIDSICAATLDDPGIYLFAAMLSLSLIQPHYPIEFLVEVILEWPELAKRLDEGYLNGESLVAEKLQAANEMREIFEAILNQFPKELSSTLLIDEISDEIALWRLKKN